MFLCPRLLLEGGAFFPLFGKWLSYLGVALLFLMVGMGVAFFMVSAGLTPDGLGRGPLVIDRSLSPLPYEGMGVAADVPLTVSRDEPVALADRDPGVRARPAPLFKALTLDGETVALSATLDTPTLLVFWAPW